MSGSKALTEVGQGALPAQVEETSGLVRLAIEKGVDVEILERLVALQEHVSARNARAEFFDALARFQDEVGQIPKTATAQIMTKAGGKYSYSYSPLDEIARRIRHPLRAHGFSYAWDVQDAGSGVVNVVAILRHIGGHEERASFPVPVETAAAMSGAQKYGAALTYGKRQSLTSVLGLTTTDDDVDGASAGLADSVKITEAQAADLMAKAEEVGADLKRFLRYLGVGSVDDIPQSELPRALQALEEKRKGVAK